MSQNSVLPSLLKKLMWRKITQYTTNPAEYIQATRYFYHRFGVSVTQTCYGEKLPNLQQVNRTRTHYADFNQL